MCFFAGVCCLVALWGLQNHVFSQVCAASAPSGGSKSLVLEGCCCLGAVGGRGGGGGGHGMRHMLPRRSRGSRKPCLFIGVCCLGALGGLKNLGLDCCCCLGALGGLRNHFSQVFAASALSEDSNTMFFRKCVLLRRPRRRNKLGVLMLLRPRRHRGTPEPCVFASVRRLPNPKVRGSKPRSATTAVGGGGRAGGRRAEDLCRRLRTWDHRKSRNGAAEWRSG